LRKAAVLVAVLALVVVPLARADGDPASDYLLTQLSFVPPDTALSAADTAQLNNLLKATKIAGYTIHVALIASRYDMGSVTILFKEPKLYAPFLSQELRFYYKGRVLVVMPNGYAVANDGKRDPTEQAVVAKLVPPKPFSGSPLAAAASQAVRALAEHAGVNVKTLPSIKSGSSSSSSRDRIGIGIGAIVLLALLGAATATRRRSRSG
jgi:hypothetical protein